MMVEESRIRIGFINNHNSERMYYIYRRVGVSKTGRFFADEKKIYYLYRDLSWHRAMLATEYYSSFEEAKENLELYQKKTLGMDYFLRIKDLKPKPFIDKNEMML